MNLAYGRMSYSKNLFISNSNLICRGYINLLEEYPFYILIVYLILKDKKKLFKKLKLITK